MGLVFIFLIIIIIPIVVFPSCPQSEQQVDVLLILGCPTHADGTLRKTMISRLEKAIDVYHMGYCKTMILCGGKAHNEYSEAESMENYLKDKIDVELIKEENSTTTYENFLYAKMIIDQGKYQKIGILTSSSHASRAYALSKKFFHDIVMFKAKEKFSIKKLLREGISRYQYIYIELKKIIFH